MALCDLDPWMEPLAELQGRALAERARTFLRDLHDEDWWRNPRSVVSLQEIWGRGGRPTCAELWSEMGGEPSAGPLLIELSATSR